MHVQVDDSKLHNHEQISWQDGIMIHHNRDHLSNSNSDMADGSESWSLTGAGLRSEGTVELRGSVATNAVSWSRAAVQKVQLWEPWQLSDPWTRQAWVSPWHSSRDTAGNLYFQVSSGLRSEGTVELRGSLATNEVSRKASSTCYNTWCLGATGMWWLHQKWGL